MDEESGITERLEHSVRSPIGSYKVKGHVKHLKLEGKSPNRCCEVKKHIKTGG